MLLGYERRFLWSYDFSFRLKIQLTPTESVTKILTIIIVIIIIIIITSTYGYLTKNLQLCVSCYGHFYSVSKISLKVSNKDAPTLPVASPL